MRRTALLLAIVAFAVYFNALNCSFVWDDNFLVGKNDFITGFKYIPQIFTTDLYHFYSEIYGARHSNFYRPIQSLSFLIDYHIWKINPFGFHLSNILLHLLNAMLVFLAVYVLCGSRLVSLFTSILFVIHPVQTSAVAYVSGRADLLAAFFILLSFIFYVGRSRHILSLAAFVLALLSKEVAVIFPLLLVGYEVLYKKAEQLSEFFKKIFPYLLIDAVYIILRLSLFNFTPERKLFYAPTALFNHVLTICPVLIEYIKVLLYPKELYIERDVPLVTSFLSTHFLLALAGVAAILVFAVIAFRRSRAALLGIIWFIIFLIPVFNIIPINASIAEHWLYIPSIGFFMAAALLLVRLAPKMAGYKFIIGIFIFIALLYSGRTIIRNNDWKDELSLFSSASKFSPKKGRVYYLIGNAYDAKGLLKKATMYYGLAIESGWRDSDVYTNLALVRKSMGDFKGAKEGFDQAIAIDPYNALAHNGMGELLEKTGLRNNAFVEYQKAIVYHPNFYNAYINLGTLFRESGKHKESVYYFEKAFSIRKNMISYYRPGMLTKGQ